MTAVQYPAMDCSLICWACNAHTETKDSKEVAAFSKKHAACTVGGAA